MTAVYSINGFFGKYRFLSNFYMKPLCYDGIVYPSAENAYQAQKQDKTMRYIFQDVSPGESKKLNKKLKLDEIDIQNFDRNKVDIMSQIVLKKFMDKDMRKKLLETGDHYLEETNNWGDTFWGVCDGVGLNQLGHILMNVRKFYKRQEDFEKH